MPGPIDRTKNVEKDTDKMNAKEVQTINQEDVGIVKDESNTPPKSPRVTALKLQLEAEKAALEKELAQYREFYEKHINDPGYIKARDKIKEINAKLGPISNELASIARAGGSKGIKIESGEYKSEFQGDAKPEDRN